MNSNVIKGVLAVASIVSTVLVADAGFHASETVADDAAKAYHAVDDKVRGNHYEKKGFFGRKTVFVDKDGNERSDAHLNEETKKLLKKEAKKGGKR